MLRANLGIAAGLMHGGSVNQLRKPAILSLDVGYALTVQWAVLLRLATWLSYDPFAVQFLGAGVNYTFETDAIFLTAALGLAILDDAFGLPGASDEEVQGLSLQVDLGQRWRLSDAFDFGFGGHFELGTPLLGGPSDATGVLAGLFVSVGL